MAWECCWAGYTDGLGVSRHALYCILCTGFHVLHAMYYMPCTIYPILHLLYYTSCPQVTTGSDVYSFGVLMWSLYMGQKPYVVKAGEVLPNMLFPHFPVHAPPQYTGLVQSCLRRDPHERPTFPEITASLVAFFNGVLGPGGSRVPTPAPARLPEGGQQAAATCLSAAAPSTRFTVMSDGSIAEFGREDRMLAESFLASRSRLLPSTRSTQPSSGLVPISSPGFPDSGSSFFTGRGLPGPAAAVAAAAAAAAAEWQ